MPRHAIIDTADSMHAVAMASLRLNMLRWPSMALDDQSTATEALDVV